VLLLYFVAYTTTQTSPESPGIYLLLVKLFGHEQASHLQASVEGSQGAAVSSDDFKAFLFYSAAFFNNMGNYKSFGDTKFVPDISQVRANLYSEEMLYV